MAQANVHVGAFDQTRHVAHGEALEILFVFHDANLRVQRGEGIRGNLGTRLGNGSEQRGFAGVRIADQADLGHDTKLEVKFAFGAGFARLGKTRGLPAGRGEITIAQTATTTFAQHILLAVLGEIGHEYALRFRRGDRFFAFNDGGFGFG